MSQSIEGQDTRRSGPSQKQCEYEVLLGRLHCTQHGLTCCQRDSSSPSDSAKLDALKTVMTMGAEEYFEYIDHSVSQIRHFKDGCLTLYFRSLLDGKIVRSHFNVGTKRTRSCGQHKVGDPLPKGKFVPGKRSKFAEFWMGAGLQLPGAMSRFPKHMHRVKGTLFVGPYRKDGNSWRFESKILSTVNIPAPEFMAALRQANSGSMQGLNWDNNGFKDWDNAIPYEPENAGAVADSQYGGEQVRMEHKVSGVTYEDLPPTYKHPSEQTEEEWLADYENASDPPNGYK